MLLPPATLLRTGHRRERRRLHLTLGKTLAAPYGSTHNDHTAPETNLPHSVDRLADKIPSNVLAKERPGSRRMTTVVAEVIPAMRRYVYESNESMTYVGAAAALRAAVPV